MKAETFEIDSIKLFDLGYFEDERGFFTERFRKDLSDQAGLPVFVQDNFSRSRPGVLRGLHYQYREPQGKLVTCLSGRIFDVAVDIRTGSKTFGQNVSIELCGERPQWLWIPAGFAHGFCVMGDEPADVLYKVDCYWGKGGEGGIHFADPTLKIKWPIANPILAAKDSVLESFSAYCEKPRF